MTTQPPTPAKRRLLAVDDNRLILRVIADYFAPQGWEVVTADRVAAARALLEQSPASPHGRPHSQLRFSKSCLSYAG